MNSLKLNVNEFCMFVCVGSGSSGKKAVGVAFSYVAGEENKVAEGSKALKSASPQPVHAPTTAATSASTVGDKPGINPTGIDYVESASLKSKPTSNIEAGSYYL